MSEEPQKIEQPPVQPIEVQPAPAPAPMPTPVPAQPITTPATQPHSGLAIAAMVIGIVALIGGLLPFFGFLLGITAVVLGIIGIKKKVSKGMAITGIVTGAVATVWNLIVTALFVISMIGIMAIGGAASEITTELQDNLNTYNQSQQTKIDAKKDFTKGSTAIFGEFEVKVNSVQRNYVPEDSYYEADAGNELIVVNVSVKNTSEESAYFSSYGFDINEDGVVGSFSTSFASVTPEFEGGNISAGATATGNIVFEVTKGETNLKLQYEESVYDSAESEFKDLTYTLAI